MTRDEFVDKIIDEEFAHKGEMLAWCSSSEIYDEAGKIYIYTSFCDYFGETNDFTDEELTALYKHTGGKVVDSLVEYYSNGQVFHDVAVYEQTRRFIEAYLEDEVYI